MRRYTYRGRKFLACDATCADSFKTDRRYGLIYGSVRIVPDNRVVSWERGSIECGFCAYCSATEPAEPDGGEHNAPMPSPVVASVPAEVEHNIEPAPFYGLRGD